MALGHYHIAYSDVHKSLLTWRLNTVASFESPGVADFHLQVTSRLTQLQPNFAQTQVICKVTNVIYLFSSYTSKLMRGCRLDCNLCGAAAAGLHFLVNYARLATQ